MSSEVVTSRLSGRSNSVSGIQPPISVGGGISSSISQHNNIQMSKADEIEVQVLDQNAEQPEIKRTSLGWICCAPCIWLRTSTTVHKIAISAATLLVTSLLVASPILFLISTAPSQLPRDCFLQDDDECLPTPTPPPECADSECRIAASSIQAKMNWKIDPCKDLKTYSCSSEENNINGIKSAQESSYINIQQLLIHNTSTGPFQKLGLLYGSCLRQKLNSSSIRLLLDELGGYLPIGALGPSSISTLLAKINIIGPVPLLEMYYDLSYGKKRQVMLIVDGPSSSPYVLENHVRCMGPKAPPHMIKDDMPDLLDELLNEFLPYALSAEQKNSEKDLIESFIKELNQIRKYHIERDFLNSFYINNVTTLSTTYPFLNWSDLIAPSWSGPIVVRSSEYFNNLRILLSQYHNRVVHNSLLILFALKTLPQSTPSPEVCTKATMWALPQVTSALYIRQFSEEHMMDAIERTELVFESLKAHLKRAPSLRGTALVKLSSLKIQARQWPMLFNITNSTYILEELDVNPENWFENILNIYKLRKANLEILTPAEGQTAWAYPPIARPFYDNFSHSIVVPLSIMLIPYFNPRLPIYMHYATVGVQLGREILRSITKSFDDKAMRCVPSSIDIFSNSSRMEILIYSGGMQIAYHSLLSLTGPLKGLERLPGLNLTPTQIFFLLVAQDVCLDSMYDGIDVKSPDFDEILTWLIAQGGSANEVFRCPFGSSIRNQKTCSVL